MSKTRKALAISAGAALGLSSLVGLPAQAAGFAAEIDYNDGANNSVFNGDVMELELTQAGLIDATVARTAYAIVISNPESIDLEIDFTGTGLAGGETFSANMSDADDTALVGANQSRADDAIAEGTPEVFDFDTGDGTALVLYDFIDTNGAVQVPDTIKISRPAADKAHGVDGESIRVYAYYDDDLNFTKLDNTGASEVLTVTFVDPDTVSVITKLERVVADTGNLFNALAANGTAPENITGTVRFSNPNINLDQTDLTLWDWDVFTDNVNVADDQDVTPIVTSFFDGNDEHDDAGKIVAQFPVEADLEVDHTYQVKVVYDGKTRLFTSTGFEVVSSDSLADAFEADVKITETANIADDDANNITLRTGTTSATWTYSVDVEDANVPVVVYATVTSDDTVITLNGATGSATDGQSLSYTTLTNSDGEVSVTVNSSTAADGDAYTVDVVLIEDDGTIAAGAQQVVTYEDAEVTSWETDTTVLSGDSLSVTATIEDQFGEGIDLKGSKQMNVGIVATDDDDLDAFAAVSGGSVTFTFDNYLEAGGSDVLTVNAYTGANDDQSTIAGLTDITITLYAAIATSAVTVTADEVDATVVYVDFEDDMDAPAGASKATINGTVIDATGSGVPGAQVTLTSPVAGALIFEDAAGDILVDSMTVSAGEAGTFAVDVWTHIADDVDVTITSGGQSATVTVAGALPAANDSISAANLLFSWTLTEVVVVNTTYRVDAFLTDVWGNGIENATVNFNGEAAAQFNSAATIAKTTNDDGRATAYLRSLEDVTGLAAVSVDYEDNINIDGLLGAEVSDAGDSFTDDEDTSWNEKAATNEIESEVNFLATAPAATADTKVNAGSFKGYVAIYAKGHEGKRLSAKVGKDWVVVPVLASNFERVVEYTGAGYTIAVRIYIDRVLVDTITVTTK